MIVGSHLQAGVGSRNEDEIESMNKEAKDKLRNKNREHQEFLAEIYHMHLRWGQVLPA